MSGYVRPHVGYVRARPDMSGLGARYVRLNRNTRYRKVDQEPR
jgi:hypothetical protein